MHLVLLLLLLPLFAHAATRIASPTGTGTACSASAPCTVQTALGQLAPGDTLTLQPGRYTGTAGMIAPPGGKAGTADQPITVQAERDGTVLLDGESARRPLWLTGGNDYWRIRGVNACCAHDTVLQIGEKAHHNRLDRVVLWDTADPGSGVISVWGSTGTVLTDIAAFGHGRKMLGRVNDTDTVVNRGVFVKYRVTDTASGDDVVSTYAYKSRNSRMYNVIAAMDITPGTPVQSVIIWGADHYTDVTGFTTTHQLAGNIFYRVDGQNVASTVVGMRKSLNPGNVESGNTVTTLSRNSLSMRRDSAPPDWGQDCPTDGVKSVCEETNWTDSTGSLTAGWHQTDGGSIPGSEAPDLLGLRLTSQPASGAWIKHCHKEDGTLDTGCMLWPWPMNTRIADALVTSGYAARGLDGQGEVDITRLILRLAGSTLPTPVPGVPALTCVGYVTEVPGVVKMVCLPQEERR